jgi:hypothetical protein
MVKIVRRDLKESQRKPSVGCAELIHDLNPRKRTDAVG